MRIHFFIIAFLASITLRAMAGEPLEVELVYIGSDTGKALSPAAMGFQQGVEEANLQGEFLGQKYSAKYLSEDHVTVFSETKPTAIIAELDQGSLLSLAKNNPDIPVFNLTNRDDQLRTDCCVPNLFHIIPSNKMFADAVAQWQQNQPESKVTAQAWHGDFKKYAASQVNKRFKNSHGVVMDDQAWSGWISSKIIADAVARTKSDKGEMLLPFLRDSLVMDGAKGLKMTFRPTGQLRQLLLLIENDEIVGEAPVRGVVDQTDMDSLGFADCSSEK